MSLTKNDTGGVVFYGLFDPPKLPTSVKVLPVEDGCPGVGWILETGNEYLNKWVRP